jgi:hypothetical protein
MGTRLARIGEMSNAYTYGSTVWREDAEQSRRKNSIKIGISEIVCWFYTACIWVLIGGLLRATGIHKNDMELLNFSVCSFLYFH